MSKKSKDQDEAAAADEEREFLTGEIEEGAPPAPTPADLSTLPFRDLYVRVQDALHALPSRFRSQLNIAGVSASDLFTLNAPLGAAIEASVVENLNELRELWDPDDKYQEYSFVRQPQVFPDVRLQTSAPHVSAEKKVLFGIELKGWFLLAKEGEPSSRYKVSPDACAPADLLVVFPWVLTEVISGAPRLLRPFTVQARYAAEQRNYYWSFGRRRQEGKSAASREIRTAEHRTPYPAKKAKFNDSPVLDSGRNFGRFARGGFMTDFKLELLEEHLAGIPVKHWRAFLKMFASGAETTEIVRKLGSMEKQLRKAAESSSAEDEVHRFLQSLQALIGRLTST
jgi:hypothetical protein